MDVVIKRGENIIVAVVNPTGQQTMQAMGANIVDMEFVLDSSVEFKLGDWCEVYGNRYYINILPEVEKLNNRRYSYRVQMEHEYYRLQNVILMNKDNEDNFKSSEFAFYGTANEVMSLLLQNANRVYNGWVLGSIKTTERKLFNFNGENLLQAINIIAESFDTEYWIDGKQISLNNRVSTTGITLSYGENKGLKSISKVNKENKSIFTRLYVLGGG